jgi:hypothetical protein
VAEFKTSNSRADWVKEGTQCEDLFPPPPQKKLRLQRPGTDDQLKLYLTPDIIHLSLLMMKAILFSLTFSKLTLFCSQEIYFVFRNVHTNPIKKNDYIHSDTFPAYVLIEISD